MFTKNRINGFLLILTLALGNSLVSCSRGQEQANTQNLFFFGESDPILYSKAEDGRVIPEKVSRFLNDAHTFGEGVKRYRMGSYQRTITDCSGFIGQAHRKSGYGVLVYQFDHDFLNFTTCTGGLKPGDVVLLAYPGRQPDHWVMMADVKDPQGKFHSSSNVIMDVSSDYIAGRPYFRGELSLRRNLLARKVYACRRHRSFDREWKLLAQQLEKKPVAMAESEDSSVVQPPTTQTEPQEPSVANGDLFASSTGTESSGIIQSR